MNIQDSLKATFRTAELAERERRRRGILAEAKLLDDEREWDAETRAALIRIRVNAEYETRIRFIELWKKLSFWKRIRAVFSQSPF